MQRFRDMLFVAAPEQDFAGPLTRAVELARRNGARLTLAAVVDRLPPGAPC